ncbi:uncharacterized protein LOC142661888 isoform X2 [Rhinoderma darwinii]|uniref:uncharacterized protein LOC142661888 isoform X2 n=1 Tax=Rhinoderma darwinii TaxID=43563 RepID=UPI003F670AD8
MDSHGEEVECFASRWYNYNVRVLRALESHVLAEILNGFLFLLDVTISPDWGFDFGHLQNDCSEEQWTRLEDWQKDIYKAVIKEIHEAVMSLGYTIINPNVVFNVKKPDESFVRVDDQSVEKNAVIGDLPDILLMVKNESPGEAIFVMEEKRNVAQPSTSVTSPLNVRKENAAHGPTRTSSKPKNYNSFFVKTEEDAYSIDDYNSAGGDNQPCPTKDDDLVKHESEEETDTEGDFQVSDNVKQEGSGPVSGARVQQVEVRGPHRADGNGGDQQGSEVSTSLEMGPKKRKVGSQVHGDILSLQEREARRLRVLEAIVKPFQAQPGFTLNPTKHQDVKNEKTELPRERRDITNTSWCKCGNCCVMSTMEESICCHEISGLLSQLNDERVCITKHPSFQELCLDQDRLDFLYRFLARIKRKNDVLYYLHKLRRTSYRAFVIWAHGFLDLRKYKPIPACVVKHVQEFLPYPEELNVGYMKMYDYPAALMALDHI